MNESEKIIARITNRLNIFKFNGDIGDIGNEIGMVIGKVIEEHNGEIGYELDDFISGIRHGVSLIDGTHDNPVKLTWFQRLKMRLCQ